jgi:hypothetical protein
VTVHERCRPATYSAYPRLASNAGAHFNHAAWGQKQRVKITTDSAFLIEETEQNPQILMQNNIKFSTKTVQFDCFRVYIIDTGI